MSYKNILNVDELKKLADDLKLSFKFEIGFTYDEIYELIKNCKQKSYYIFNLLGFSHLDNQMGHYIACIIIPFIKKVFVYTCYGIVSFDVLKLFYKFDKYKDYEIVFDLNQTQKSTSNSCGWYCLRWLKEFDTKKEIVFDNYIIYYLIKEPFNYDNLGVRDYSFTKNWNPKRYDKYTNMYVKIINE